MDVSERILASLDSGNPCRNDAIADFLHKSTEDLLADIFKGSR
jgi:hypothetical protein